MSNHSSVEFPCPSDVLSLLFFKALSDNLIPGFLSLSSLDKI